MGFDKRKKT